MMKECNIWHKNKELITWKKNKTSMPQNNEPKLEAIVRMSTRNCWKTDNVWTVRSTRASLAKRIIRKKDMFEPSLLSDVCEMMYASMAVIKTIAESNKFALLRKKSRRKTINRITSSTMKTQLKKCSMSAKNVSAYGQTQFDPSPKRALASQPLKCCCMNMTVQFRTIN
mmetsp:Transcript_70168/g.142501  ORF Transcript_70168/g.142501 Transcript_70168/m.142501 type:complete len:169 (-) Transcript_70168:96-602(-)